MLIMLPDNILYAGSLLPSLSHPSCRRRVTLVFTAPVAAVSTESTTIHPGFLRQFLPVSLEQSSFGILRTRSTQRCYFHHHWWKGKIIADCFVAIMPSGIGNKNAQHLQHVRKKRAEKRKLARENSQSGGHAQLEVPLSESLLRRVDVEDDDSDCDHPLATGDSRASGNEDSGSDSDSDSEVAMTDAEDLDLEEAVFDKNAFEMLIMGNQHPGVFEEATFHYQRRPDPSLRTVQRKEKAAKELQDAAKGSKKIYTYFQNPDASNSAGRPNAWLSSDQLRSIERQDAIKALDKKLRKKTTLRTMNWQNLVRHKAVLSFLRMQEGKQLGETRDSISRTVARCFGKGAYFARRLITWEIEWIKTRSISEGRRGCFAKVKSWLHDEGVLLAVREWIQEQPTDQITAHSLAKAVGDYLDSKKAASTVEKITVWTGREPHPCKDSATLAQPIGAGLWAIQKGSLC